MSSGTTLILSSGVALGAYIPPLITYTQLRARGCNSEFFIIENLIYEEKKCNILQNKFAFHSNFKVALLGQKISEKSDYGIDSGKVQFLYSRWDNIVINRILVFSGFWMPIVENYLDSRKIMDCLVDMCHLDSSLSASWKNFSSNKEYLRDIWFFNLNENIVNHYINISDKPTLGFKSREERFVIHGGGWGMGTYKEKIRELTDMKVKLDVINYEIGDLDNRIEDHRYFMIDPDWKTWERYSDKYVFPPFAQIQDNNQVQFDYNGEYPAVYDLIRNSYGIISKPGGATLLDSFSSATPVIFLEPFGEYERDNAILWKKLGFGIDYDEWVSMKCPTDILLQMHENLKKKLSETGNIIDLYVPVKKQLEPF